MRKIKLDKLPIKESEFWLLVHRAEVYSYTENTGVRTIPISLLGDIIFSQYPDMKPLKRATLLAQLDNAVNVCNYGGDYEE